MFSLLPWVASLVLAQEPLSRTDIRLLAQTDDIRAVSILEEAFDRRLELRRSLGLIAPVELEAELVEALYGLERLDGTAAASRAQTLLHQVPATCTAAYAAREVLARRGDISLIREALSGFFDDPRRWGRLLGEAARATDDLRLEDFRNMAGAAPRAASPDFFQTRIERKLAESTDEWKLADLLFWVEEHPSLTTVRILSWIPEDTVHEGWVRHLLSVLAGTGQGAIRLRALAALGWRKAAGQQSVLVGALRDEDPEVVAVAARALGEMSSEKGGPELARLATSSDERIAGEAIRALVRRAGKEEALRLAEARDRWSFRSALPVMEVLDGRDERESAAWVRVMSRMAGFEDRRRAIRFLAEADRPVLARLELGAAEIEPVIPYLARSAHSDVRAEVLRAGDGAKATALAAVLLSPRANPFEKEEAATVLGASWPRAIALGGADVIVELDRLTLRESPARAYREPGSWPDAAKQPAMLDALAWLPGSGARQALERMGSVAAIERLMRRDDRQLSLPALGALRRQAAQAEVHAAIDRGLLLLGAPGSFAIVQRRLARTDDLIPVVAGLPFAPLAGEAFEKLSRAQGPRPDIAAALVTFGRERREEFRRLTSIEEPRARRRIHAALALSGRADGIPLLADGAVHDPAKPIRLMAFRALSEIDVGPFTSRLHRAAGDADRDIRYAAALALTPTGEEWAVRLLAAEMDPENPRDRVAFLRVLHRLTPDQSDRLLEMMFWDETGNPFTDYLYEQRIGGFPKADQERVWSLLSKKVEGSPFIAFIVAGLDLPDAAKAVYARLR